MEITPYVLNSMRTCSKKAFVSSLGMKGKSEKFFMAKVGKDAVHAFLSSNTSRDEQAVAEWMETYQSKDDETLLDYFPLTLQREKIIQRLSRDVVRYLIHLDKQVTPLATSSLMPKVRESITLGELEMTVQADLVYEEDSTLHVIKIKEGKPKLALRGRKRETSPQYDFELFSLHLLGAKLAGMQNFTHIQSVKVAFHHLQGKQDKKATEYPEYNQKDGWNVIHTHFPLENVKELHEEATTSVKDLKKMTVQSPCLPTCKDCQYEQLGQRTEILPTTPLEEVEEKSDKPLQLTSSQMDAISFREGIARINAGAGSGKTTVLALRVVELLSEGANPEDILLITFTNKGAEEMREKIGYWLEKTGLDPQLKEAMTIQTFNRFCQSVIDRNYLGLRYDRKPFVVSKTLRFDLIRHVLEHQFKGQVFEGLDYERPFLNFFNAKGIIPKLDEYMLKLASFHGYTDDAQRKELGVDNDMYDQLQSFYAIYEDQMGIHGYITYDDQLSLTLEILETMGQQAVHPYQHIMVDEFQDTSPIQFDIVLSLLNDSSFQSLMIVGDDAQAIYGFRQANAELIQNFSIFFEEVTDIKLAENFRSSDIIIQQANRLLEGQTAKRLISMYQSEEEEVSRIVTENDEDKISVMAGKIKTLASKGKYQPEDIAIIARQRSELIKIKEQLDKEGVPSFLDVSIPLIEYPEVQTSLALAGYLLALEQQLEPAVEDILPYLIYKHLHFNALTAYQLDAEVMMAEKLVREDYQALTDDKEKKQYYIQAVEPLLEPSLFEPLLEKIDELIDLSTQDFFYYLHCYLVYQDDIKSGDVEGRVNAVTLITGHSVKGKEYPVVFAVLDKYFSDFKSSENLSEHKQKQYDEERRLQFVTYTRAKEKLFIVHKNNHNLAIDTSIV